MCKQKGRAHVSMFGRVGKAKEKPKKKKRVRIAGRQEASKEERGI